MELTRSAVPISELIDAATQTLAPSAEKAHIQVEIQVPTDLPPVDVDADKIRRVLINLLDNALRYTPQGKPVQIRVVPEYPGHKILVQVADSGPGIPEKERERIFDQFWQVKENQPLRGTKGNGIGLTFCQRVMEAHGERIWVEASGPLPGACFAFTLPLNNNGDKK
jgi:two-component system clock-associated histidine kinase SasA